MGLRLRLRREAGGGAGRDGEWGMCMGGIFPKMDVCRMSVWFCWQDEARDESAHGRLQPTSRCDGLSDGIRSH